MNTIPPISAARQLTELPIFDAAEVEARLGESNLKSTLARAFASLEPFPISLHRILRR